jgi:hypothetical protein
MNHDVLIQLLILFCIDQLVDAGKITWNAPCFCQVLGLHAQIIHFPAINFYFFIRMQLMFIASIINLF